MLSIDNLHSSSLNKRRKVSKNNNSSSSSSKQSQRPIDAKWTLKEVPELPFLYLKEKTSVVVINEDPQDVASRVVECAKEVGAFGEYNGDKVCVY